MKPQVGLIVLAAGGATRMGLLKQLLPYHGRSLLRHAAESAAASGLSPVIVVLGANADRLEPELEGLPVQVARNADWETGLSSSIRTGIRALQSAADVAAVVLTLCDQPLVGPDLLRQFVEAYRKTGKPVIASEYQGTLGVPVLFERRYFEKLERLEDGDSPRCLIGVAGKAIHSVPFPAGAFDVDTPQDYERLRALTE
jgi:molybdenum cofactor cytidylyltransferase